MKDDASQGEIISGLLGTLESNAILAQTVPPEKVLAAWNAIVANSGVENPEDLRIDIEEWKQQQELAQQQAMEQETLAQEQMIADQQVVDGRPDQVEVDAVTAQLQELGVPDELIIDAQDMLDRDYSADEVLAALEGYMSNARG